MKGKGDKKNELTVSKYLFRGGRQKERGNCVEISLKGEGDERNELTKTVSKYLLRGGRQKERGNCVEISLQGEGDERNDLTETVSKYLNVLKLNMILFQRFSCRTMYCFNGT